MSNIIEDLRKIAAQQPALQNDVQIILPYIEKEASRNLQASKLGVKVCIYFVLADKVTKHPPKSFKNLKGYQHVEKVVIGPATQLQEPMHSLFSNINVKGEAYAVKYGKSLVACRVYFLGWEGERDPTTSPLVLPKGPKFYGGLAPAYGAPIFAAWDVWTNRVKTYPLSTS